MKLISNKYYRTSVMSLLVMAVASLLSSCGMVYDEMPECRRGVELRFVYDYNMEFANAFPSQVDCLNVLVYDAEGNFVTSRAESSSVLADEDYRMIFDLPEGQYHFVAYGGMNCPDASFHFLSQPGAGTSLADNKVAINADCLTSPTGTYLHPLFYGDVTARVTDKWQEYVRATVKMMKDTNNIRVVLQQVNGEPLDADGFDFHLTDDNLLMDYDNSVIPSQTYGFRPWTKGNESPGVNDNGTPATVCYAEFSIPRLMMDNNPKLEINRIPTMKATPSVEVASPVVDIPLIPYLLLVKSQAFAQMPNQEFLDRESRWTLFFFLDRNYNWYEVHIQVRDWTVRINRASFGS